MTTPTHVSLAVFQDSERPQVPKTLYRRFKERAYAELFLNGEVLIRNLLYYRGKEGEDDPRSDPLEGMHHNKKFKGSTLWFQKKSEGPYLAIGRIDNYTQKLLNPERFYVYCFSTKLEKAQEEKFGKYLVRINRTDEFIRRISSGILERKNMCWGHVVYYNKINDDNLFLFKNTSDKGIPIWMMKPDRFSDEHEFRIVIERDDVEHLWIKRQAGAQRFDNRAAWENSLSFKLIAGDMRDIAEILP